MSPTRRQLIDTFIKGSLVQAHSGAQAIEDLIERRSEGLARTSRQSSSKKVLQKGGVLYARDARHAVLQRESDELARAREQVARIEAQQERQLLAVWKLVLRDFKQGIKAREKKKKERRWLSMMLCSDISRATILST